MKCYIVLCTGLSDKILEYSKTKNHDKCKHFEHSSIEIAYFTSGMFFPVKKLEGPILIRVF